MKPRNGKVVALGVLLVVVTLLAIIAAPIVSVWWHVSHSEDDVQEGPATSAPGK